MGKFITLLTVTGGCARCRQEISAYCESPRDIERRHCPRCHLALKLTTGKAVRAWCQDDGACHILAERALLPPDLDMFRRREEAIANLGVGLAAAMGIMSAVIGGRLTWLRLGETFCFGCGKHCYLPFLTERHRRYLTCNGCAIPLTLASERILPAVMDGLQFWPVISDLHKPVTPLRQDLPPLAGWLVSSITDLDLELLGLK